MSTTPWSAEHLTGLKDLNRDELLALLDRAAEFKRGPVKANTLNDVCVANVFLENSTRTRCSFTIAAHRCGADVIDLGSASSAAKGETILDTCLNLQAMGAGIIVIRCTETEAPHMLARELDACVVNGGDGVNEHPTQGLLDIMTLRDKFDGDFAGKQVAICGDIRHSRVARSNIHGLKTLGAEVAVICPPSLAPDEDLGVEVIHDLDANLTRFDVFNVLRIQLERQKDQLITSLDEYYAHYGVSPERLAKMKPEVVIMHPGPMNRGVEIASEVADGPQSVILEQVNNGVHVRMAALTMVYEARKARLDA